MLAGPGILLVVAMLAASFGQMALGALAPVLRAELGLGVGEFGVFGTIMFGSAALWSPIAGRLSDRFGGRSQLVLLYTMVAASWAAMAAAHGRELLAVSMALGGIALAASNPATNELIASHGRGPGQPRLLAWKQGGAQLAGAAAGLLPAAAALGGWRAALWVLAAAAALGAVLSQRLLPSHEFTPREASEMTQGRLNRSRTALLSLYAVAMGTAASGLITYLPLYGYEIVGLSATLAGGVTTVLAVVGFLALFGWIRLAARTLFPTRLLVVMSGMATVAAAAVLLAGRVGPALLWPALFFLGLTYTTWLAVAMLTVVRSSGDGRSGRVSGKVLLAFFIGMTIGPTVFAWLTSTASYSPALMVVALLFLAASAVAAALQSSWRAQAA